jgi:hypothetical protein
MHKVRIERFNYIPSTIKLVKKDTQNINKIHANFFGRSVGLPMQTSKCHQIPCHPFRNHGGLHIVVEWGHDSKNV